MLMCKHMNDYIANKQMITGNGSTCPDPIVRQMFSFVLNTGIQWLPWSAPYHCILLCHILNLPSALICHNTKLQQIVAINIKLLCSVVTLVSHIQVIAAIKCNTNRVVELVRVYTFTFNYLISWFSLQWSATTISAKCYTNGYTICPLLAGLRMVLE